MVVPLALLKSLNSLTDESTLATLYQLASNVPADEAIVEIGTYRGASACWLAAGARAGLGAHVWTIDPHDLPGKRTTTGRDPGTIDFSATEIRLDAERQIKLCGLENHITMVQGFSTDVAARWTGPKVGLLFIDGDHRESAARRDMREWQPHLSHDAVIAWDDYADSHPGVKRAVNGLVMRNIITEPDVRGRLVITGIVPPYERRLGRIGR